MAVELFDPFEWGVAPWNLGAGWTASAAWTPLLTTQFARKDSSNNGGLRSLQVHGGHWCKSPGLRPMREWRMRCGVYRSATDTQGRMELQSSDSQLGFRTNGSYQWEIVRNGTVLATSGGGYNPAQWFLAEVHAYLDDTSGFARLEVDEVEVVSFDGDTLGGADPYCVNWWAGNTGNLVYFDDILVTSISLRYKNGTDGLPAIGDVLSGTNGGEARVSHVEGDAASGVVLLYAWNGVDFLDGEALTGGDLDAEVDAPTLAFRHGLEPNSTKIGNGWTILQMPVAVGDYNDLTNSAGNQTSNQNYVNALPPSTSTYLQAEDDGEQVSFSKSTLPASAAHINHVTVSGFAASDLMGLNDRAFLLRYDGVDTYSPAVQLSSASRINAHTWNQAPDDAFFDLAMFNAAQFGVRFTT